MSHLELSWVGSRVSQVAFDFAVTIRGADDSELRVECAFHLSGTDFPSLDVDPAATREMAGHLIQLLQRGILTSEVDEKGALHASFEGGVELFVPVDPAYEAWTYVGGDGSRVVATPGGGRTVWSTR